MISSLKNLNNILYKSIFYNQNTLPSAIYSALKSYSGVDWRSLEFTKYNIYDNYTEAHLFTNKSKNKILQFQTEDNQLVKYGTDNECNKNTDNDLIVKVIKWSPDYQGVFHHHTGLNCYYKILDGKIKETIKHKNSGLITNNIHKLHGIGYINDNIGLHKIKNLSDDYTYSLHVYFKTHY